MKLGILKRAPLLITTVVIGLVCGLQMLRHDFVERMENITYDWRVRQAAKFHTVVTTNLAFVNIGDEAINLVGKQALLGEPYGLSWPRHLYGRVVNELDAQGAKAVAFDVLFEELRPDHKPVRGVSSDQFFAQEMQVAGTVILAAEEGKLPAPLFLRSAHAIGDIDAEKDGDGILRRAKAFHDFRNWHEAFRQWEEDPDKGIDLDKAIIESNRIVLVRPPPTEPIVIPLHDGKVDLSDLFARYPANTLVKPFETLRIWHMGIVLAAQALQLDLAHPKIDLAHGQIILLGANGIARTIPVDRDGFFYIDWGLSLKDDRLLKAPIEALLGQYQVHFEHATNRVAVELASLWDNRTWVNWHDKLVVVGSSASGNNLTDRGATPLARDTLLVSKHWNVANSVLTGRFIHRSSTAVEFLLIILMGMLGGYLTWTWRAQSWVSSVWIIVAVVFYTLLTVFAFVLYRYWMPLVLPVGGALLGTHFCLLAYLVFFEQVERRRVRSVFTKVVSPDVVAELLQTDNLSSVNGAQRNVTVFFSDIRGFTEMTDVNRARAEDVIKEQNLIDEAADEVRDAEARETLKTVNLYLEIIANMVLKNGGTVDKFIGDCVMAFWGAPVPNPHHALMCVRAAIDTQRAVYEFNQKREEENRQREAQNLMLAADGKPLLPLLATLVVGTGINTGIVTVGLMGSEEHLNYTVFGREVNLASRLETVSGRSRIIISEATLAEIIQDDATLALSCQAQEPVKVKGIRQPVQIYEVPWRDEATPPTAADETPPSEAYNTGYFTAAEKTE